MLSIVIGIVECIPFVKKRNGSFIQSMVGLVSKMFTSIYFRIQQPIEGHNPQTD